jgi:hypothetical protein
VGAGRDVATAWRRPGSFAPCIRSSYRCSRTLPE